MFAWQEFVIGMTNAIAWPTVLLIIGLVFRRSVMQLAERLSRVSYGNAEAEFERTLADAIEIAPTDRPEAGLFSELDQSLLSLAEVSPRAAILEAWLKIENILRKKLKNSDIETDKLNSSALISLAKKEDLITGKDANALVGLSKLRNIAVHSTDFEIDQAKARDFIILSDAIEYALKRKQ